MLFGVRAKEIDQGGNTIKEIEMGSSEDGTEGLRVLNFNFIIDRITRLGDEESGISSRGACDLDFALCSCASAGAELDSDAVQPTVTASGSALAVP